MSDETPTPEPAQPTAATPEAAPAEVTEPATAAATPEPTPAAATPAAAEVTEPAIPVAAPAPEPTVTTAPPVATAPPVEPQKTTKAVAVPMWVLASIAALIGAIVMFGVGYAVGDGSNDGGSNTAIGAPFGPNGSQGGPQQLPNLPNMPNPGGNQQTPNRQTPNQQTPNQGGTANPSSAAFLGVAAQPANGGLEITQVVSGSAADDGGLQVGDVITSFDGTSVSTPAQLSSAVGSLSPGDQAKVVITRNGQTRTVTVVLGSRSATSN